MSLQQQSTSPKLESLVGLFYDDPTQLGRFAPQEVADLSAEYRQLLAHNEHMTVTVEAFHGSRVDVRVLQTHRQGTLYSRRITLLRRRDGQVVQFGIVRLNLAVLDVKVRSEIESEAIPLGRILIAHDVLRHVELARLWSVQCGQDLATVFSVPTGTRTCGRTALIYCNGEPAVELLEVVAPLETR